ncbi:uncharacterized protein LOC131258029 [Magnolia sinica]|uniref:uncharacterized protein LOC131258029 n=1 Tax=Magnolia sinica TaxID=86752 RepID=UPI002658A0CD|nr:uncharacterized protein LOC131258029 [Magnolia sinica]
MSTKRSMHIFWQHLVAKEPINTTNRRGNTKAGRTLKWHMQKDREICRLDARIRQNLATMQQLEHELGAMSSFDYRKVFINSVWSNFRTERLNLALSLSIQH